MIRTTTQTNGKPFLKWAGGKTQLLHTIDSFLPETFSKEQDVTYIEPFVGGGAMLFFMLQKYPNIKRAIINDINPHLVTTYKIIRDEPYALIDFLTELQTKYREIKEYENQKAFYLDIRDRFNNAAMTQIEEASYMLFMNRTCFNGLYRENSKGRFNVPFGKYANPTICDKTLIISDSELLQKVEIINGDFAQTQKYVNGYTFFYFDPPYRPLYATSSFNSYVKEVFDNDEQLHLKDYFTMLSKEGCFEMLSNSDGKGHNEADTFLYDLYQDVYIEHVSAKRSINVNPSKRGILTELLIRNYDNCQDADDTLFNL